MYRRLYLDTLIIGHTFCSMLRILNELKLLMELQKFMTNSKFWTKKVKVILQQTATANKQLCAREGNRTRDLCGNTKN